MKIWTRYPYDVAVVKAVPSSAVHELHRSI